MGGYTVQCVLMVDVYQLFFINKKYNLRESFILYFGNSSADAILFLCL